jgi:hypothetical protein
MVSTYLWLLLDFSSSTTPDRLHQHHPWSSSPTTIYINKLHHVAAITDRGHRQRQQNLLLLLLATPRNSKQKSGFNPDNFDHYHSIAIDNYHFFFVHHDLAARVAVYFYLHVRAQVFSLQLLRLLRHGGQLLRTDRLRRSSLLPPPALARMAHDGPCLRTSGAGNTDACLRP